VGCHFLAKESICQMIFQKSMNGGKYQSSMPKAEKQAKKWKWFISCCLRFMRLALICQTMN